MRDAIVVLNAGSSSLKFSVFCPEGRDLALLLRGAFAGLPDAPTFSTQRAHGPIEDHDRYRGATLDREEALDRLLEFLRDELRGVRIAGVGHRVVHGGRRSEPLRIDEAVLGSLHALVPLAPLHQPYNLAPMRRLLGQASDIPQVACFDTAFHRTNPEVAQRFALPEYLHEAGVRRYGFHGLSYEFVASRLPEIDPLAAAGRTIVLHLGNGASLCALLAGRSVATTMGLTALDGIPMGTRSGALDPGVVPFLMRQHGLDLAAIERLLYERSGLLGVSGVSSDMRVLLASDAPAARQAVDLFVYRTGREIGSLAAALGGLDAVVFTAGIGENSPEIRARVAATAEWLGLEIDPGANRAGASRISSARSRVSCWVIPTNEEVMIARHTRRVIESG